MTAAALLHCPKCCYDLTGLRECRCPECGEAFDRAVLLRAQAIRRPKWWVALLAVMVCSYGPFAMWIPFQDHAVWWKLWPILPGFFFGFLLHPREPLEFIVMGAATALILAAAWRLATRASGTLLVVCFLLLLWACFNSLGAYSAMRM